MTAVSPSAGSTLAGTAVTITGTGFLSGAAVNFAATAATNVAVVSATTITATTRPHGAGYVAVAVRNVDGQSGSKTNAYQYVAPPPAPTSLIASPTTTSDLETGLTSGKTYSYVVQARDLGGSSPNSAQVSATPR